jgi:hypothetical protein
MVLRAFVASDALMRREVRGLDLVEAPLASTGSR